jgi:hypothetical protein
MPIDYRIRRKNRRFDFQETMFKEKTPQPMQ